MKKLLLFTAGILATLSLAGCGRDPVPPTPSKTEYTEEDKALMDEFLCYKLPFWSEASTVSFNEDYYVVTLTGNTKATDEAIEAFGNKFVKANYMEVDRNPQSYRGFLNDVSYAYDFSDDFIVLEYEKNYKQLQEATVLNQIVAIGADAETGTLVCAATIYFSYYDEYGCGMYVFTNEDQQGVCFLESIHSEFENVLFDLFTLDETGETSYYKMGSFVFPDVSSSYVGFFGLTETAYIMPWYRGNLNVAEGDFTYQLNIDYEGIDPEYRDDYMDKLENNGYVFDEKSSTEETAYYTKDITSGTCYISISAYYEEYIELVDGTVLDGFDVAYEFAPTILDK